MDFYQVSLLGAYDEAGNRNRKITYKYNGSEPDPVFDDNGDNPSWDLVTNEFYVRDVSGKEIAIYNGSSLTQWNVWGLDNIGKINADTTKNYYIKDHLGSIRVVLNSTNTVISAQDYDAWGYVLENRSYNSTAMKYDFTGKERDNETSYDYFGARYYDSRLGRWGQVEPLYDEYIQITPYNYSLNNPVNLIDEDGNGPREGQSWLWAQSTADQVSNAIEEIGLRFNSVVENFSTGDIGMGILEAATLPTLSMSLIPASPMTDFIMPIGLVKGVSLSKGFTMSDKVAKKIAARNITNAMIKETIEKGTVYTGHESGTLTYVLKNAFENKKALVVGQNEITGAISTAIKMRPRSLKNLLKRVTPLFEESSKNIGFK